MSEAPFVNISSPLTAVPLLIGLFIGLWGCLTIVGNFYGVDVAAGLPLVRVESGIGGPLLLLGVAVFAFIRGQKMRDAGKARNPRDTANLRPSSLLERLCLAGAALGILTLPYWFGLPVAEAWVVGLLIVVVVVWRKFLSGASRP